MKYENIKNKKFYYQFNGSGIERSIRLFLHRFLVFSSLPLFIFIPQVLIGLGFFVFKKVFSCELDLNSRDKSPLLQLSRAAEGICVDQWEPALTIATVALDHSDSCCKTYTLNTVKGYKGCLLGGVC